MFFILIAIVWSLASAGCVSLCVAAAAGDDLQPTGHDEPAGGQSTIGVDVRIHAGAGGFAR